MPALPIPLRPLLLALVVAAGCGGTPDEEDLREWAGSEQGFQKIARLVRDGTQPAAVRVRALELVVEKRQELRVRGMIERIEDLPDREAVARQLVAGLAAQIERGADTQLAAKDTILLLTRYLTPEELDRVQKIIADWAFADITWDTPAAEIRAKLESRISATQIADLGPHGLEAAAILLANGFIAEQMVRYLSTSPVPGAKSLMIKAFRRFFPTFLSVNPFYLDAIRKTQDPDGAKLLFELYRNDQLDQKSRDAAYSVGAMMLDQPTIKGQLPAAQPVIDELVAIGSGSNAEDRWLSAANILAVTGGAGFDQVLGLFADDKIYGMTPLNSNAILDLCFELHKDAKPDAARPAIDKALAGENRIRQAIAITCAKVLHLTALQPRLSELAAKLGTRDDVSLEDFLGDGTLANGKPAPMTVGFLAANAVQGLEMLTASRLDQLDDAKRKARHFVITVELRELGEPYAQHVEERYQQSLSKRD